MNKAVQRIIKLQADQNGNVAVPDRIHLMSTGHWHTPYHGAFEMTADDLNQMVANFDQGMGLVESSKRAPINYGHDTSGKAAGWIDNLSVQGDELWGDIEWTPAGRTALEDGEYRYISPEWNPRDFPWENPQVEGDFVDNVFNGAALTNIPLFTKLKPVMASREVANGEGDISNDNEGGDMDLSIIRVKKLEELSDEEKAFLAEHKSELTDEELNAFGLVEEDDAEAKAKAEAEAKAAEEAEAQAKADEEAKAAADAEAAKAEEAEELKASKKVVSISASKLKQLEAAAEEVKTLKASIAQKEAHTIMASAVKDGRVKSDQLEKGEELLVADRDGKFKAFVEALPVNSLLGDEKGSGEGGEDVIELTAAEKDLAEGFGNTPEEIAEYKKSKETKE